MPSYVPCKKNDANGHVFYVSLVSQANTKIFQANPTLAAGDVKIAIDDGAPANLGTLPVVDADFTKRVKVVLSQAETNGDNLTIIFSDAAGAEWCDLTINIQTAARQVDDLAYPATSGRSLAVEADGMVYGDVREWLGVAPLALTAQRVDAKVGAMDTDVVSATAFAQGAADKVWSSAARTLTSFGTLVADIWAYATRTLTSFGTLASDIWANATRTLTALTGQPRTDLMGEDVDFEAGTGARKAAITEARLSELDAGTAGKVAAEVDILKEALVVHRGTAQAGAAGSITLDAAASATDDLYNNSWVVLVSGTGVGQVRLISDYVGSTKVASITPDWTTNPDATSVFIILPAPRIDASTVADQVWDEALSGHLTAGTTGEKLDSIPVRVTKV